MIAKLKQLRQKAGLSQAQLAEAIGVSQQSVNKYENHSVEPDIDTLIRIADYFHVSVDYLIDHTGVGHAAAFDLNTEEARLVEDWRQLHSAEKESIRLIVQNYLRSNRNAGLD